jgi:basic membrane protein A
MDRRTYIKTAGLAGLAGLAGCAGGGPQGTPTETATPTETPTEASGDGGGDETETETETPTAVPVNVGMVYATGGLGDGSFNDQAQQGVQQAQSDFGIQFSEAQPDEVSQFKNFQQQFAQSMDPDYDLICCIGFLQQSALQENAPQFPDQSFMIVDSVVDADNVASYVFAEEEGSYLVGHLAGLLTTTEFEAGAGSTNPGSTNVGFVGGVESPLIEKFQAGYEAGVRDANEDVNVQTSYVGDFNDPAGGKEAALAMYNSGADIVYHASGNTGTGVFQAAQEQGKFAIGVDRDQSVTKDSFADVILASMVKRVDTAVYTSVGNVVDDDFQGGTTTALGLEADGVGIAYGQQLGSAIPGDLKDRITTARDAIVGGEIDPPTDPGNV